MTALKVHPELSKCLRPQTENERAKLKESIQADGVRDPIVVWGEYILDGHNRYQVANELGKAFNTLSIDFADIYAAKQWMRDNQRARRNLEPIELVRLLEDEAADLSAQAKQRQAHGQTAPGQSLVENLPQPSNPKTRDTMGEKIGVSGRTYASLAKVVREGTPELQMAVREKQIGAEAAAKIVRQAGSAIAAPVNDDSLLSGQEAEAERKRAQAAAEAQRLATEEYERAKRLVKAKREQEAAERKKRLEAQREAARKIAPPEGKYGTIVIDPPWPMQKIERDVAPNQTQFDYPVMQEYELAAMEMPADDSCHLFLWTTHKFLPMALRLCDSWGFKYVLTMVWHKNGGFQPFGLPQYNCEFAVYARKGSPKFIDTKAFPTCFNAPRGAHSEKPEEFYDVIRRVTDGQRIDIFNRRKIEGFDTWGDQSQ